MSVVLSLVYVNLVVACIFAVVQFIAKRDVEDWVLIQLLFWCIATLVVRLS